MIKPTQKPAQPADLPVGADGPFAAAQQAIIREIDALLTGTDETVARQLIEAILSADRVFALGVGRSKLAVDAFAMRLMHLGLTTHVAADVTTPAIGPGDLLLACSGSGETPTVVELAESAARDGACVACVTANTDSRLGGLADIVVHLDDPSQVDDPGASYQFIGTRFEQGAFLFFDCLVLMIAHDRDIAADTMFSRHANLE